MRRRAGPLGGYVPHYKRHSLGQNSMTVVPLALPGVTNVTVPLPTPDILPPTLDHLPDPDDAEHEPQLSSHHQRKKAEVEQWAAIRISMQKAGADTAAPPSSVCCVCRKSTNHCILRCEQCGPLYVGCEDCVCDQHECRPTHSLEQWLVCTVPQMPDVSVENGIMIIIIIILVYTIV